MVMLESTVHRILDILQSNRVVDQGRDSGRVSSDLHSTPGNAVETAAPSLNAIINSQLESRQVRSIHRKEIEELGKAYMTFCADQPLPLFPRERFVESLLDRSDATLFGILANSLRFMSSSDGSPCSQDSRAFRDAAHSKTVVDVSQGNVGVSTLQALCLVVLFDFASKSQGLHSIGGSSNNIL